MSITPISVNFGLKKNYFNYKNQKTSVPQKPISFCYNDKYSQDIFFGNTFHFDKSACRVIIPNKNVKGIKSFLKNIINPVEIQTVDGLKLKSWFIEPKAGKPVFYFLNGTNSNKSHQQSVAKFFSDNGYGALMMDYRQFGENHGVATEKGLYLDAEAGLNFLNTKGFKNNDLLTWGYSMGGAIATKMATQNKFKALILDSTFTNGNAIKKHFLKAGFASAEEIPTEVLEKLMKKPSKNEHIPFNTQSIINEVDSPLLIMHSGDDSIIPHEMSEELATLNPNAKLIISEKFRHIDRTWTFEPIKEFIESLN